MGLGLSKPNPYTRFRVPNHVSILSIPKLDKSTLFHTRIHTKTLDFHTHIVFVLVYQKSILFHTELNKFHTFLYKIIAFHTCDLLFPFLLSSFLFSSSSSSSFLFSSLLSVFALSFSKTKMRYLFWFYPYLILSPFYFTFSLFWSILNHPVKGGSVMPQNPGCPVDHYQPAENLCLMS